MGAVPGQVRRRVRRLVLVDEGLAQPGVRFPRAGEVAAHDGQFGGPVGGQRPLPAVRGEPPGLGRQPSRVIGTEGQPLGQGGHLRPVAGRVARNDLVDQAGPQGRGRNDRQALLGEPGGLGGADPARQGVGPVLRAVQAHQAVVRVEDRAAPAPDLVRGQREHQAAGRGVARQRRHGELAGAGQDRLHQVVDGVDVPPGLFGRVVGGLDHVQVDAVGEQVPGTAEHDHLDRAALGVPVGGEQAAALAGAHGPAGEGELQVADVAGFPVADLLVRAPARRRHQRCGHLGNAGQRSAQCFAQRHRGRQLEGLRAARGRAVAQLRDPDRPVGGGAADRPVPPGHDRPGLSAQLVFLVPADQVVLGAAEHVQDAGAGVGRPQFRQHRGGGIGRPVDPAVGLPAQRTALPGHVRAAVVQRLRPVAAGAEPGHGLQHRRYRGVRDLGAIRRALRAVRQRELGAGPDVTGVHLGVRLQDGDPPAP